MKRVLASGVFDLIHPGHRLYLREAKSLGDHLTVVITSDAHAARTKLLTRNPAAERATRVAELPEVDGVIIGAEPYDLIATTRQANPGIIVLGFDQSFNEEELGAQLQQAGIVVEIVRVTAHLPEHSTTKLRSQGNG